MPMLKPVRYRFNMTLAGTETPRYRTEILDAALPMPS